MSDSIGGQFGASQFQRAQAMQQTNEMDSLRQRAFENDETALREAAQQFESIFMGMVLKSMRQANAVFEKDNPLHSRYTEMYRDMHDGELAKDLAKQGTLGLADLLVQQFGGDSENFTSASALRDGSNLDAARRTAKENYFRQQATEGETSKAAMVASEPANDRRTGGVPAGQYYGLQRHQAFTDEQSFIAALRPHAEHAAKKAGLAPEALLAQAALETGWGQKLIPGSKNGSSNNLFNIKADQRWSGDKAHVMTLEYDGTVARKEQAAFRVYDNVAESFDDFVRFLQDHPRYQPALAAGGDVKAFSEALQAAGYATDPQYADKIQRLYARLKD